MPVRTVRLASAAADDLRGIRRYTIAEWGRKQWLLYSAELDALFEQLGNNPALGPMRDDVRSGLRSFPVGSHIVWYREQVEELEIARILHAAMDPKTRL